MKTSLLLLATTFLFSSCKTREDIVREEKREMKVENISTQMQDTQRLNVDFTTRLQNLEEKLSDLSGRAEESQHQTEETVNQRIRGLEEKIDLIQASQSIQTESIADLTDKVSAQKKYISEVLGTLKSLSSSKSKRSSKSSKRSSYEVAMGDYKKGRYKSAKSKFLTLLKSNRLDSAQKSRVIHNMGMISYMNKSNDQALSYFSQLFTQYPKSGYNKNGLLFLAKTFKRTGKKEEAKQTLNELLKLWPKARQVKEAKKLLSKL